MRRDDIRNIIIIAHVDHGKTTLVDCLLRQSGEFRESQLTQEQILDSNDLERERGITILAKNIAIPFRGIKINVIDTPGHADFGGEVERVLRMADGAVLLIDAAEGPMPQTRFVLQKALECGIRPIVLVNKIDRPDSRANEVVDEALDLIVELGGEEMLDDFQYLFSSSKEGFAKNELDDPNESMLPLLERIVETIPGPEIEESDNLQMLVTTLDWSEYVGRIAVGRIQSGEVHQGQQVVLMQEGDKETKRKVSSVEVFHNLGKQEVEKATAGDICALVGLEGVEIGDTICSVDHPSAMPRLKVDEPTLEMVFGINSSPLAGRDGKYVTNRQVRERLMKELERNVALRVRPIENSDMFGVAGRGVLHLSVLIETMRREGYELSIGKPQVITRKNESGAVEEPFESLVIEVPSENLGPVMELVGARRGDTVEVNGRGEFTQVRFSIPARGLIGLRTKLLNATAGTAIINHRFEAYRELQGDIPKRQNGVMISMVGGKANAYAMDNLQKRGEMFIAPGDEVYEGMIVAEHVRDNDLPVNPIREKKLTNIRAAGSDDNILLKPPRLMSLEAALEYIEEDEFVEVTPNHIRLRKALLKESDRKRFNRANV